MPLCQQELVNSVHRTDAETGSLSAMRCSTRVACERVPARGEGRWTSNLSRLAASRFWGATMTIQQWPSAAAMLAAGTDLEREVEEVGSSTQATNPSGEHELGQ